ncbi:hypothetical protein ACFE04_016315 [Oxalis oulophora]
MNILEQRVYGNGGERMWTQREEILRPWILPKDANYDCRFLCVNEQRKEAFIKKKIEDMQAQRAKLTATDLSHYQKLADRKIAELEATRDHDWPDKPQLHLMGKPSAFDPISVKEKFIHAKYAERVFVRKPKDQHHPSSVKQQMWEAVRSNDRFHGLFNMLSDNSHEIRQQADSALSEFLQEIKNSQVTLLKTF